MDKVEEARRRLSPTRVNAEVERKKREELLRKKQELRELLYDQKIQRERKTSCFAYEITRY
jgi:hypothetical protein